MKYLAAAQLDDLADQAEAFQMVLLDAYDASGHGWAPATGPTDPCGLLGREDKNCVLCGEPMPCSVVDKALEAGSAIRRALMALGVWEEVLLDADARHSPSLKGWAP